MSICYEDADSLAFLDIQPVNPGHVLVVPKEHFTEVQDMPRDLAAHLFEVALHLLPAVQKAAGAPDINVIVNSGAAAGQDVMHYHIHLVPRREGDGFDISLPFEASLMPNRQQLDGMAARIGSLIRDPLARHSRSSK